MMSDSVFISFVSLLHQRQHACSQQHRWIWVFIDRCAFQKWWTRLTHTHTHNSTNNSNNNNSSIISSISPCKWINFLNIPPPRHRAVNMVHTILFRWSNLHDDGDVDSNIVRCAFHSHHNSNHIFQRSTYVLFGLLSPTIPLLKFRWHFPFYIFFCVEMHADRKTLQTLELTAAITFQMHFTYCAARTFWRRAKAKRSERRHTFFWQKDEDDANEAVERLNCTMLYIA